MSSLWGLLGRRYHEPVHFVILPSVSQAGETLLSAVVMTGLAVVGVVLAQAVRRTLATTAPRC